VWHGAPGKAGDYDAGDEIVVVGRVRRRFFRSGGATQSRTEVVVDALVPARQAKRAATLVSDRCAALEDVVT
jgi:single-strand DNA-binding protein